jgi:hypothetical protein
MKKFLFALRNDLRVKPGFAGARFIDRPEVDDIVAGAFMQIG